jgi:hypothetical protein
MPILDDPKGGTPLIEPNIMVNGQELSFGQAMTMRFALTMFDRFVHDETTTGAYAITCRPHTREILALMMRNKLEKEA